MKLRALCLSYESRCGKWMKSCCWQGFFSLSRILQVWLNGAIETPMEKRAKTCIYMQYLKGSYLHLFNFFMFSWRLPIPSFSLCHPLKILLVLSIDIVNIINIYTLEPKGSAIRKKLKVCRGLPSVEIRPVLYLSLNTSSSPVLWM